MLCRTCLETLNFDWKFSFKTELCLGKTVEDVLIFFIPKMVKTNPTENFICSRCMDEIQTFMNFIKKCIATDINLQKNYVKRQKLLRLAEKTETVVTDVQKKSYEAILPAAFEQKISSNEKENFKKLGEKLFKDVFTMNLEGEKRNHKYPQPVLRTVDLARPIKTYSRKDKNVTLTSNDELSVQNNVIADEIIENSTKNSQSQNHSTVSNKNSNTDESVQQDNTAFKKTNLDEDTSIWNKVETFYPDFYTHPRKETFFESGRVLSASVTDDKLHDLIQNGPQNDMEIMTSHSLHKTGPKRILFLGNVVDKCVECDEYIPRGVPCNEHYRSKHPEVRSSRRYRNRPKPTDTPVKCPVCSTWHRSVRFYEKHVSDQHKDFIPYKCDKCTAGFKTKMAYDRHMQNYNLYLDCNLQRCPVCKEKVRRFLFREHANMHVKIPCDVCGVKFLTQKRYDAHRLKHQAKNKKSTLTGLQKRLCPICGLLITGYAATFRIHCLSHTAESKYLCDKCSKMFKTRTALNKHLVGHEEGLQCPICKQDMKQTNLKNHMKLKHSDAHARLCDVCGAGFSRPDYYKRHMRWHEGITKKNNRYMSKPKTKDETVACKYCDKKFQRISNLRLHLLNIHRQHVERFKCPYCNVSLSSRANMLRHQKRHQDFKNVESTCKVCWRTVDDMEAHMQKHKHIQRRKCDDCGETFLSKHMLQHHRWDKHYKPEMVENEREEVLWDGLSDFLQEQVEAYGSS